MASVSNPVKVRFGVFECDFEARQLRKHGLRIKLQEQPFRILEALLDRPGKIVSRDELRARLWPEGVFVDFDRSLNKSVVRLREALNDCAESPRYIETLPRLGYRFLQDVVIIDQPGSENGTSSHALSLPETAAGVAPSATAQNRTRVAWAIAVLLLFITGGTTVSLWHASLAPRTYSVAQFTSMQGSAQQPALSPDGKEVAFTWNAGSPSPDGLIYVQSVGNSVARRFIDDGDPAHAEAAPRWSSDGRQILYIRSVPRAPDEIWSVERTGGIPRMVVRGAYIRGFDIAPDGRSLVLSQVSTPNPRQWSSLYLVPLDSMREFQLTYPDGQQSTWAGVNGDVSPRFSPDGRSIVFARVQPGGEEVGVISSSGGRPEWMLHSSDPHLPLRKVLGSVAWMPDGKSLLVRFARDDHPGLWQIRLRDKNLEPLPIGGRLTDELGGLAISADGRRLAFVQAATYFNVWRYALSAPGATAPRNDEPVNLTRSTSINSSPIYSPDGTRFAFASDRSGHREIYIARSDGSGVSQLTSLGKDAGSPRWSPDGSTIAFACTCDKYTHIFAIEATGGPAVQMTFGDVDQLLPRFSRDGKWIYFARQQQPNSTDLWKFPAGGGAPIFVAPDALQVWESTDGKTMYYNKWSRPGIFARFTAGGEERQVISEGGKGEFPFWVVGQGIYYPASGTRGDAAELPQLAFFDFASRRSFPVAQLRKFPGSINVGISPDGKFAINSESEVQSDIMLVENFKP